jgi:hypothetical protein
MGNRYTPRRPAIDRFREKVNYDGPLPERHPEAGLCHLWAGAVNAKGYGVFWADGSVLAHSWLWRQERGSLPPGHVPDHWACDRPQCVRLDHMRPVTHRENTLRGTSRASGNRAKERCPQDHPYTAENTYEYRGWRLCRTCRAERARSRHGQRASKQ